MTDETILEVVSRYKDELRGRCEPKEGGGLLNHAYWMCGQIPGFLFDGRREKAMRWLGFIQGVLYSTGVFTIEEMKGHNAE